MKIKFCGAAKTVTGSCHLLTLDDGYTILLDAGLYQGSENEFTEFNNRWLFDPKIIDCLILSHAHIDHSGRIPKLVKDGFKGNILCTSATRDLSAVMLIDSAKIQERDAYHFNKKMKSRGLKNRKKLLYNSNDVYESFHNFIGIGYSTWYKINNNVSLQFRDSGHIFGSASITLRIKTNKNEDVFVGFSGDIGRPGRPILRDPVQMDDLDCLICESTYGGVKHDSLPQDENTLLSIIEDTCVHNKGKLLIPAFSVGRTQEIVHTLDKLETERRLPRIPVFVDSPMAVNATEVFQLHPDCFDSEILEYMIDDPNPFGFSDLKYIRKTVESKKLNKLKGPAIIISASGMMTGGRIIHHLFNHIEDSRNTILIVGYCADNTLGAKIRRGDKTVDIFGSKLRVNARVKVMDSYSAHADESEIVEYLSNLDQERLKRIFLVHGIPERQGDLRDTLIGEGFINVQIPSIGDEVELGF